MLALVRGARGVEAGGVGADRLAVQPGHDGQHGGAVHPAGQEHAVRHVAALVQIDALLQRAVQAGQGSVLGDGFRPAVGQGEGAGAVQDVAVGDLQGLAGQHALDAGEDGFRPGGELHLQQLLPCGRAQGAADQAGGQQGLRLGREGQAAVDLRDVQRLDAKGVAGQRHAALGALVDGDGEHAAQGGRVAYAVAQPQVQRRLAVAAGGEASAGQGVAQLAVVVDLAVGDQRGRAGIQGLVPASHVDDGQAGMDQRGAAHRGVAAAIGAAVRQGTGERGEHRRVGRRAAGRQDQADDAAHQACSSRARVSRQRCRTGAGACPAK